MKEVSTFWTTSGRIDSFEFEIVAGNNFEKSLGYLSGVKGGKLTFGYDTDLKVSGSLEVSSTKYIENCVIRVHYCPKLSELQKKDIILATCFAYTDKMNFDKGRYYGTIELVSVLARYTDDVLQTAFTIGKNKTYKNELARLLKVEATGGKYKFGANLPDKKCTSAKAFERGKPPMEVIQAVADGLDGRIDVDEYGVMVLEKYFAPAKKSCVLKLPVGKYSVTLPNIEIEEAKSDVPNRVAYLCEVSVTEKVYVLDKKGNRVKYTSGENKGKYKTKNVKNKMTIIGRAQVKSTHPLHFNKRGRWVTKNYTEARNIVMLKVMNEKEFLKALESTKKYAAQKAAQKLSSLVANRKKYTIECYYLPIKCGQVVEFEYIASGIKLHVQGMVTNIDMDLAVGAKMQVTLKHVRYV